MAKQTSAEFRALVADAMAHFQAGRLAEAESAYRAALALVPGDPAVTHNLGVTIAAQGRSPLRRRLFRGGAQGRPRLRLGALQPGRRADARSARRRRRSRPSAAPLRSSRSITRRIAHWASSGWRKASAGGRSIILRAPTSCGAAMTGPPSRGNR